MRKPAFWLDPGQYVCAFWSDYLFPAPKLKNKAFVFQTHLSLRDQKYRVERESTCLPAELKILLFCVPKTRNLLYEFMLIYSKNKLISMRTICNVRKVPFLYMCKEDIYPFAHSQSDHGYFFRLLK